MTETQFDPAVEQFLRHCIGYYDELAQGLQSLRHDAAPETVLEWVWMAGGFAGMQHPGRFCDGAVENAVLEVATTLPRTNFSPRPLVAPAPSSRPSRRRVLHVATVILGIGGHTRTILNWIRKDSASEHSIVATYQGRAPIPPGLPETVAESGGQLHALPDDVPLTERAAWLREFAARNADIVMLHLSPNDVIPLAAFAAPGGPPVGLINLADQCYWLGGTVADTIVHLREIGASTSKELRFARSHALLPIPLHESPARLTRSVARQRLGIPDSELVLLSVGRSLKYAPSARHNFFSTAHAILERNPQARLYLVGVKKEDHAAAPGFIAHERMNFVGPVDDVTAHQCAADVYLEGFPFGSQTALLESVLPGVACVPAYSPATPLLATHDFALTGLVDNPESEAEYIERASRFVSDAALRAEVGDQLRRRVLHYHVEDSWNGFLEQTYGQLLSKPHAVERMPKKSGEIRSVDLAISEYHATRLKDAHLRETVAAQVRAGAMGAAFGLRQRGYYLDAFRVLRAASRSIGWDSDALRFAAKLLPHRLMQLSARA